MDSTSITLIKNSSIIFDLTVLDVIDSIISCNLCYFKIYYNDYQIGIKSGSVVLYHFVLLVSSKANRIKYYKVI